MDTDTSSHILLLPTLGCLVFDVKVTFTLTRYLLDTRITSIISCWFPVEAMLLLWTGCVLILTVIQQCKSDKPNIIFILADDLGWNEVSWHNRNIKTPYLEVPDWCYIHCWCHHCHFIGVIRARTAPYKVLCDTQMFPLPGSSDDRNVSMEAGYAERCSGEMADHWSQHLSCHTATTAQDSWLHQLSGGQVAPGLLSWELPSKQQGIWLFLWSV